MSQPALIRILPPQLANQIAAGEVVERPASVVKELVENSLDAGANQIQIDIEKGGAQLIRIRDNGCGIGKQDLTLALARHATSKIASLEDLEAILSLGFRGEALASISSVSRLTLTSRPNYQPEAWQAYAQGREMAVEIQPASHPVGTTIEVANLFFNTPARRKFLRTDKTEFAHIDEMVRRIALAKPNVSFTLNHNGKRIRHYKAVSGENAAAQFLQQQKRIAAICGEDFIQHASHIDWQHGDLHLYGWIGSPKLAREQNDLSYSYVNGRMMRDKTINHAIRQAYGEQLPKASYPAFVLFLDLNPSLVDVNVHPAKHEVRFHQGRLVHDFILQGVLNALQAQPDFGQFSPADVLEPVATEQAVSFAENPPLDPVLHEPPAAYQPSHQPIYSSGQHYSGASGRNIFAPKSSLPQSAQARKWYGELLNTTPTSSRHDHSSLHDELHSDKRLDLPKNPQNPPLASPISAPISLETTPCTGYRQALALVKNQALLLKQHEDFSLLPLKALAELHFKQQLQQPASQSLLIPLNLTLDTAQSARWQNVEAAMASLGFSTQTKQYQGQTRLAVLQVPSCLRQQNLQQLLLALLSSDELLQPQNAQPAETQQNAQPQAVDLLEFFAQHCASAPAASLSEAINQLAAVEQHAPQSLAPHQIPVDFAQFLDI